MTTTLGELEIKVQLLEDLEKIKTLHKKYIFYFTCRQWEDMLNCFAEDATVDIADYGLRKGEKEIMDLADNVFEKLPKARGHIIGKPAISVKGDKASSYWNLYIFPHEPSEMWEQGRYDCEYVKENSDWKFSSVKFTAPQSL